jgi:hypothetical protein
LDHNFRMLIDSHLPGQYPGYLVSGDADEDAQEKVEDANEEAVSNLLFWDCDLKKSG